MVQISFCVSSIQPLLILMDSLTSHHRAGCLMLLIFIPSFISSLKQKPKISNLLVLLCTTLESQMRLTPTILPSSEQVMSEAVGYIKLVWHLTCSSWWNKKPHCCSHASETRPHNCFTKIHMQPFQFEKIQITRAKRSHNTVCSKADWPKSWLNQYK